MSAIDEAVLLEYAYAPTCCRKSPGGAERLGLSVWRFCIPVSLNFLEQELTGERTHGPRRCKRGSVAVCILECVLQASVSPSVLLTRCLFYVGAQNTN